MNVLNSWLFKKFRFRVMQFACGCDEWVRMEDMKMGCHVRVEIGGGRGSCVTVVVSLCLLVLNNFIGFVVRVINACELWCFICFEMWFYWVMRNYDFYCWCNMVCFFVYHGFGFLWVHVRWCLIFVGLLWWHLSLSNFIFHVIGLGRWTFHTFRIGQLKIAYSYMIVPNSSKGWVKENRSPFEIRTPPPFVLSDAYLGGSCYLWLSKLSI